MEEHNKQFNDVDFGQDFNNFDPEEIDTDDVINAVFIVDISPSITSYEDFLNDAYNKFVERIQKGHVADSLFVSTITFNNVIKVEHGFQPIINLKTMNFRGGGYGTDLYRAVETGLKNAIQYREELDKTGVNHKTLVYIITDGEDNGGGNNGYSPDLAAATRVKKLIQEETKRNEKRAFSFNIILFGVGSDAEFENAANLMGIEKLARVGANGVDEDSIYKMIDFISSSITSSSSGGDPTAGATKLNF